MNCPLLTLDLCVAASATQKSGSPDPHPPEVNSVDPQYREKGTHKHGIQRWESLAIGDGGKLGLPVPKRIISNEIVLERPMACFLSLR